MRITMVDDFSQGVENELGGVGIAWQGCCCGSDSAGWKFSGFAWLVL